MMNKTDIIIIGAGPAGYKAAEYAAKNGLTVTLFDYQKLGGTCLNVGCIPTKALAKNADLMIDIKQAQLYGLTNLQYTIDYQAVVKRKDAVVKSLVEGVELLMSNPHIKIVRSKASIVDAFSVEADGVLYSANNIIIATGAVNKKLPNNICKTNDVLDSTDMLNITNLPKSLCIIGAGVIGLEFASIFNAFGVEVSVVEFLKECLPSIDSDIAKRLRKSLEKRGISFYMQSAVVDINKNIVTFINKKQIQQSINAEKVLVAVGRMPNTSGLNLDSVNVDLIHGAIPVSDDSFNVIDNEHNIIESLYAVGDVNGKQLLAHAAEMQAIHVINQILGIKDNIRFDIMPAAIFTNPEAATVGYSENLCKEEGIEYSIKKAFWRANGKALAMNESDGLLKLIVDNNGLIIGAHAYGAHSADIIQEISVLMCSNINIGQMRDMTHIHPTFSEIIRMAIE